MVSNEIRGTSIENSVSWAAENERSMYGCVCGPLILLRFCQNSVLVQADQYPPKHCIVLNGLTKNVFTGDHDKVSFAFDNDLFMIDPSRFCNYFFVCVCHSAGLLCAKSWTERDSIVIFNRCNQRQYYQRCLSVKLSFQFNWDSNTPGEYSKKKKFFTCESPDKKKT